jgi:hypothetical protein
VVKRSKRKTMEPRVMPVIAAGESLVGGARSWSWVGGVGMEGVDADVFAGRYGEEGDGNGDEKRGVGFRVDGADGVDGEVVGIGMTTLVGNAGISVGLGAGSVEIDTRGAGGGGSTGITGIMGAGLLPVFPYRSGIACRLWYFSCCNGAAYVDESRRRSNVTRRVVKRVRKRR